jgi:hypothetical protein
VHVATVLANISDLRNGSDAAAAVTMASIACQGGLDGKSSWVRFWVAEGCWQWELMAIGSSSYDGHTWSINAPVLAFTQKSPLLQRAKYCCLLC